MTHNMKRLHEISNVCSRRLRASSIIIVFVLLLSKLRLWAYLPESYNLEITERKSFDANNLDADSSDDLVSTEQTQMDEANGNQPSGLQDYFFDNNQIDIEHLLKRLPNCMGKEHLVKILLRSGHDNITFDDCAMLPTWNEVTDLYGDEPVVYGMDSCERYLSYLAGLNGSMTHDPAPRVAGLFNTGTNALAQTFNLNFEPHYDDYRGYNMPGGKHVPARWKYSYSKPGKYELHELKYILPVVIVRDPLRWMQSMCKAPYGAQWLRGKSDRCPNLVPSDEERHIQGLQSDETFVVALDRASKENYTSIADMWTDWNLEYATASFPRLMIRFEDLIFHAEEVIQLVAQCVGIYTAKPFKYLTEQAKSNSDTSLITALAKYGRGDGRYDGLLPGDLLHAAKALDPRLLRIFRYPPIHLPSSIATPAYLQKDSAISTFDQNITETVTSLVSKIKECSGKEKLVSILFRAGFNEITREHCVKLPGWHEVEALYGDRPIIHGLDTCQRYRDSLSAAQNNGTAITPAPRVAGLFNTGTNALAQTFNLNIEYKEDYKEYNVPYGKHVPTRDKWLYDPLAGIYFTVEDIRRTLPIVLVRDPFRWMPTMCRKSYNAEWERGLDGRCPNLIPSTLEREVLNMQNAATFNLTQRIRERYRDNYESLATLWSEWNRLYLDSFMPRLMIRFEDTLFHAEQVMDEIKKCAGLPSDEPFKYFLESTKQRSDPTGFVTAMAKYGRPDGRYDPYSAEEALYLQSALDPELMQLFGYKQIPIESSEKFPTG